MGLHWEVAIALQNKNGIGQNKEIKLAKFSVCILLDCILVELNITKGLQNV